MAGSATHELGIDQPLAIARAGVTSYYQADGLGSITSLTNISGATANTYTYDSFGNQTASTGTIVNPFRYTGREFDSEAGNYFYRARYYDQGVGRFVNEDPTQFRGGGNFYSYVANSPASRRDPSGLLWIFVWNSSGSVALAAGSGGTWGHASILLDDGTYISWWPGAADDPANPTSMYAEHAHWARDSREASYANDVQKGTEGEGTGPDEAIYINSLDENKIRQWWRDFQKNKKFDSYNRNCSTTAIAALKAGGSEKYAKFKKNRLLPTPTPNDVLKYAQALQLYNHGAGFQF